MDHRILKKIYLFSKFYCYFVDYVKLLKYNGRHISGTNYYLIAKLIDERGITRPILATPLAIRAVFCIQWNFNVPIFRTCQYEYSKFIYIRSYVIVFVCWPYRVSLNSAVIQLCKVNFQRRIQKQSWDLYRKVWINIIYLIAWRGGWAITHPHLNGLDNCYDDNSRYILNHVRRIHGFFQIKMEFRSRPSLIGRVSTAFLFTRFLSNIFRKMYRDISIY